MFGKSHAKFILRYYEQTCQTFQSPHSLHKPPSIILFHTYLPQWVCGQISENIFFFLDLLVRKLFFDKNY